MKDHDPRSRTSTPTSHASGLVAVVGRPNVGKSTLFNRLVGRRDAIVHDEPGVTRDRHYGRAWSLGRSYTIVDTGGFDPDSDDPMRQGIAAHVQAAIEEADVVVCVLDGRDGAMDADRSAVSLLRRSKRPVLFVANKVDSDKLEHAAMDLYTLGIEELIPVSALHGRGFGKLEEALVDRLPREHQPPEMPHVDVVGRIAVVGRPNAGKSSLVNRLAGVDRMLVDDRPGTTVDTVDTVVERHGRRFVLVDTAGIRRRSSVTREKNAVEIISVLRALRAIDMSDVAVLLCDAVVGVAEQDAKILGHAAERGRGVVVALNKADCLTRETLRKAKADARDKLSFAPWAPMLPTSARTGRGMDTLLRTVEKVRKNFERRVSTGELNRFFETVLETHPPPTQGGKAPRLTYITQAETSPPRFVVMTNAPDAVHFSYQRYVVNQLRKQFDFEGIPLRVSYRRKRGRERT